MLKRQLSGASATTTLRYPTSQQAGASRDTVLIIILIIMITIDSSILLLLYLPYKLLVTILSYINIVG